MRYRITAFFELECRTAGVTCMWSLWSVAYPLHMRPRYLPLRLVRVNKTQAPVHARVIWIPPYV